MEATTPWMPGDYMPPCPACARRAASGPRPFVQRLADGSELETDIVRGASFVAEDIDVDELTESDASIVAITIPSLPSDDVIQLRFPRACLESAPTVSLEPPDSSARRPANVVVLPPRWFLLEATVATGVSRTRKGCIRIEFDSPVDDAAEIVLTIVRHALPVAM